MEKRKRQIKDSLEEVVTVKPLEVSLKECDDDFNKMLKKFTKKVRKEEVLKPFYGKLMFYTTKGQKKRKRKLKGIWNTKKHEQKLLDE